MGWNSWNSFANIVTSQIIRQQAKTLVSNGMKDAGYEYVVIDEGWWLGERDAEGKIVVNPKQWPAIEPGQKDGDMANIAAYIHGLGLKAGIYTDAGHDGCSMYPDSGPKFMGTGSEGHYDKDFVQFSKWGFDYVKVDWCGGAKEGRAGAILYTQVAKAILQAERTTGHALFFSICEWGSQNPWFWGPGVGGAQAAIWRTGGDIIAPVVESLRDSEHEKRVITERNLLDSFEAGMHPEAQHTGYYNDLDMMVMGMRGMTDALDRIHMGLWAISSAPLMVGSDLTRLSPRTLSLLNNKEALTLHHDPYGLQPIKVAEPAPGIQVWAKPLAVPGTRAISVLNRTDSPARVKIDSSTIGLERNPKTIRDVWNRRDLSSVDAALTVPANDLALLMVVGDEKKPVEYVPVRSEFTGMQSTKGPTFAVLHYTNHSGRVAITRVKSSSGLSTSLALPPAAEAEASTVGLILPHGVADLSFEKSEADIRKLDVYSWNTKFP